MRHEIIDPNQFELNDKVVSIKRVSKTVKGGRNMRSNVLFFHISHPASQSCLLL